MASAPSDPRPILGRVDAGGRLVAADPELERLQVEAGSSLGSSLARLEARSEDLYFSGHGPEIPEGPRYVRFLTRHRQAREASILHRLAKGEADIPTMVRAIYIGIDPRLTGAAGYSVLAHLEDLVARGIVATDGDPVIGGSYRLAS